MFAIIETGGKQYKVSEGDVVSVEKLAPSADGKVSFDKVLLKDDGKETVIGTPYVKGSVVSAVVAKEGRGKKKIVFRFHPKTRYRKTKGHRQAYTAVSISKIS